MEKEKKGKKAEYLISGVRMNPSGTQIESLRRHKAVSASLEDCDYISRSAILEDIKNGVNYATAFPDKDGNLRKGSAISIYKEKYLRSNENNTEKDNLGSLPQI
ncbi:MAG: DUF3892 domain-containing protein [Spirochaetia bacterium]|nr:DUF3892 domain-containing protein [Spirochaetia bacterium]